MLMTKTKKTPLMTTETYGLTFCSSRHVLKSKLLHCLEAQNGFVPNPSRHDGKTVKTERITQWCTLAQVPLSYRLYESGCK